MNIVQNESPCTVKLEFAAISDHFKLVHYAEIENWILYLYPAMPFYVSLLLPITEFQMPSKQ